jgi:hypothetical protein
MVEEEGGGRGEKIIKKKEKRKKTKEKKGKEKKIK